MNRDGARTAITSSSDQRRRRPAGNWPALLDELNVIIWEADPSTFQFTYVSRGAERVLGYPVTEWLDRSNFWVGLLHPEDRDVAVSFCRRKVEIGEDHEFEYRVVHRNGDVVWLRDLVSLEKDDQGRTIRLRGMMVNVTEVKEAEQALRQKESRLRLLSDHVLDLVSLHAEDGRFLYASRSAMEIVGYAPDELVGRGFETVVFEEDLPSVRAAIRDLLEGGDPPAVVFRVRHKDGSLRWCETKGSRVSATEEDGATQLVGVTRDISERRALQEELTKAQRLEALGRLAGGIAHDFNNLLTVIRGHLEFLREGVADRPDLGDDVEEMSRAVERAGALTGQLLTFGRRDLSRVRPVDLCRELRGVETLLQRLIPENINITLQVPDAPLRVELDPVRFEQVLVNLAVNARDAMPMGGDLTIVLSVHSITESSVERMHGIQLGTYAVIQVVDTGEGMTPQTLARIFEPFFTTKGADHGTGLGLAIVHGVVRQSGGHVQVESVLGAGSTFQIWWPIDSVLEPAGGGPGRSAQRPHSSETVLLAEDEPTVRNLVTSVLERHGYRVIATGSIEEALDAFHRFDDRVHLVVANMVLPRGTGIELADRIRPDHPDLPVLLLTHEPEDGVRGASSVEDGLHLLAKPFTSDGLVAAVRRALEQEQS